MTFHEVDKMSRAGCQNESLLLQYSEQVSCAIYGSLICIFKESLRVAVFTSRSRFLLQGHQARGAGTANPLGNPFLLPATEYDVRILTRFYIFFQPVFKLQVTCFSSLTPFYFYF